MLPGAAAEPKGVASRKAGPGALSRDPSIRLDIRAENIRWHGRAIEALEVKADLLGGVISIEKAAARLPGKSVIDVQGRTEGSGEGPRFVGALTAASEDPRGLFAWLGLPVEGIGKNGLRKLQLSAGLEGQGQRLLQGAL